MAAPPGMPPGFDECGMYRTAILEAMNQRRYPNAYNDSGAFVVREMMAMARRCRELPGTERVTYELGTERMARLASYSESDQDRAVISSVVFRHREALAQEIRATLPWREWAWAQVGRLWPRSL